MGGMFSKPKAPPAPTASAAPAAPTTSSAPSIDKGDPMVDQRPEDPTRRKRRPTGTQGTILGGDSTNNSILGG